MLFELR